MDWKIELIMVPVTDVDRAIRFYVDRAGFALDHDHTVSDELRFVQLTPTGSACSIAIGTGLTDQAMGPASVQIVVADVETARAELVGRGAEVSDIQHLPWGRFAFFNDPDGNRWSLQELIPQG